MIQPPGEPREQHLGDVQLKNCELCTQHFIKNKMTGRVHILWRIFWKNAKKLKNEVTGTEIRRFWLIYLKTFDKFTFFSPVSSILPFFGFLKNTPE